MTTLPDLKFYQDREQRNELIPVAIQHWKSLEVLMLGTISKETLSLTLNNNVVYFFKLTRQEIWLKGEKSGVHLKVKEIRVNCDKTNLLILVDYPDNICHTGERSCFYRRLVKEDENLIWQSVLEQGTLQTPLHIITGSELRNYQATKSNSITVVLVYKPRSFWLSGNKTWKLTDKILLLQRAPNPYNVADYKDRFAYFWELIGGGEEPKDGGNLEIAARRELREETGYEPKGLELVGVSQFSSNGRPASNYIYIVNVEDMVDVNISKEHVAYQWVTIERALHLQLAFKHTPILQALCLERGDPNLKRFVTTNR